MSRDDVDAMSSSLWWMVSGEMKNLGREMWGDDVLDGGLPAVGMEFL